MTVERHPVRRRGYTGDMADTFLLLLLLLFAAAAALVLLVVLLLRRPDAALDRLRARVEEALREEQRAGRGELRQQLDSLALSQGQRIEDFGRSLGDLTARTGIERKDEVGRTAAAANRRGWTCARCGGRPVITIEIFPEIRSTIAGAVPL